MAEPTFAPVVRVELFEDRAAVTRRVVLPSPGRHHLHIGPITPVISDRAITFPGPTPALAEEVRVERVRSLRRDADPKEIEGLAATSRIARERVAAAKDALERLRASAKRKTAALAAAQSHAPRGMLENGPAGWVATVATLADAVCAARVAEAQASAELSALQGEADKLAAQLNVAREGHPVFEGFLHVSVLAMAAGELLVRYVVPCALWRPAHRATLTTSGAPRVAWDLVACCWNATGEDWNDVELVCSTARPGDLASPPVLHDDEIRVQKRSAEVVVEVREETIAVAREAGARAAAEAPGVDDGGEPRVFAAEGKVTLPSTGRPVRVPLGGWSADAAVRWLALPERSGAVVLRGVLRNAGSKPILAGPVEIVRDGMAIGRGKVGLVAPGEPFPCGFGTNDGVRVRRRVEHAVDSTRLTGRQWHTFEVEIHVAHLGAEPCRIEVRERLPTSELKEVNVGAPKAEPALDAPVDRDGFVRWTLELSPGERRVLELTYTVDAAANVHLPW